MKRGFIFGILIFFLFSFSVVLAEEDSPISIYENEYGALGFNLHNIHNSIIYTYRYEIISDEGELVFMCHNSSSCRHILDSNKTSTVYVWYKNIELNNSSGGKVETGDYQIKIYYLRDNNEEVFSKSFHVDTCTDSDSGSKYYTKGVTEYKGKSEEDSCNGSILTENYCLTGSAGSKTYNCDYGCEDGACLLPDFIEDPSVDCYDSDGEDYENTGFVFYKKGSESVYLDECG